MTSANRHTRREVAAATRLLVVLSVLSAESGVSEALAGDPNPPPGPVAPTMKPLTDVEPRTAINATNTPGDADSLYKITQAGSYYLTGNITGEADKIGIEIAASGVTLDLMGFELAGVPGSLEGIRATVANSQSIAIRDGAVRNWGGRGVDLSIADNCQLTDLRAISNGSYGMEGRNTFTVTNCVSSLNAFAGIRVVHAGVVTGCSAYDNAGNGIEGFLSAVVTNCSAFSNGGIGINFSTGSAVTACTAALNGGKGIVVGHAGTISNCTARSNGNDGLAGAQGCTITNCVSSSNSSDGIEVGEGTSVIGCTVYDNLANGILAFNIHAVVSGCTVTNNHAHGISIGAGVVTGCESSGNVNDGIRVVSGCQITNNKCTGNGLNAPVGAGIHVLQGDCHIEGNFVMDNDVGFDVDSAPSATIHNVSRSNTTNYDIFVGNMLGTIATSAATMNSSANTNINLSY